MSVAKKKKAPQGAVVVIRDLSSEVPSPTDNVVFRSKAPDVDAELERIHAKYRDLEIRYEASETHNRGMRAELRRYRLLAQTLIVGGTAKAGHGMAISAWLSEPWWANCAWAAGMIVAAGYLAAPTVREIIKLAQKARNVSPSEPADSPE